MDVMMVGQGQDAARAALSEVLAVPDLDNLGISAVSADLLTVLTLLESLNRCSNMSDTLCTHRFGLARSRVL